jgi:3-deoxy-D-manno-octulosonic-acid transferase
LILYRLLMALALPVMLLATLTGRWPKGTWRARLGLAAVQQADWWVHGASLGELASARAVIAALAQDGGKVHVTTNTATGLALVAGWGIAGVRAGFAPFDAGGAPGRVLRALKPRALIVVENEFWPARIAAASAQGVPVIYIGARLSERSARRWAIAGALMRRMLAQLTYLSAQDAASEARFLALGLPASVRGARLNLKAGVMAAAHGPSPLPRSRTLLAASTHDGEEDMILTAFMASRSRFDHLILAPRHAIRGDAVARLIASHALPFARRSMGAMPEATHPVFLADTTGEMDLWYGAAGATIIGGSFADKGGHTPFEPAAYGSALIHGPSLHNFAEVFAKLDTAGACIATTVPELAAALNTLTAERQSALAAAACRLLQDRVDVAGLVAIITAQALPKA